MAVLRIERSGRGWKNRSFACTQDDKHLIAVAFREMAVGEGLSRGAVERGQALSRSAAGGCNLIAGVCRAGARLGRRGACPYTGVAPECRRALFVAEGFDGVEAGGAEGGDHSADQAYGGEDDSEHAAQEGDGESFGEELEQDVAAGRA